MSWAPNNSTCRTYYNLRLEETFLQSTRKDIALSFIRNLIEAANIGDQLPSEDQLAVQCDVSRTTIRAALNTLETEGQIVRRHGLGTFVSAPRDALYPKIEVVWSVSEAVRHSGFEPAVSKVSIKEDVVQENAWRALKIAPKDRLTEISRIILADQSPGVFVQDFMWSESLSEPRCFGAFDGENFPKYLAKYHGIHLTYALSNISVMSASREIGDVLELPLGAPLLFIEQTAFTDQRQPMVYSLAFYREGLVTYTVKRQWDALV